MHRAPPTTTRSATTSPASLRRINPNPTTLPYAFGTTRPRQPPTTQSSSATKSGPSSTSSTTLGASWTSLKSRWARGAATYALSSRRTPPSLPPPPPQTADSDTSFVGATHAFGNTEARLIRKVLGVKARDGAERWDSVRGTGAVRAHRGDYHDALHVKRNTVILLVHSIFGGFARGAVSHLRSLAKRPVNKTEYEGTRVTDFVPHWSQRISAALVTADARRCQRRLPGLRTRAIDAARQRAA